ncbi:MAG: transcription antitermination factor NusB [Methylophilaceae bacterium]|uniref:transcription antitermination factor NusB n=1 Tax=Methylovorus sp. MM2 TaxID=1848038 RepID=UPI0007DE8918|nr:transcription antitermination factor NusB [Methylovorus sp. MM2]OAM51553.1 N utilization substance protein B [Methylovorus sp. MM2]
MSEDKTKSATAKPAKTGKNRRKSRELALKGLYHSFLNQTPLRQVLLVLADDEDLARADEDYFRQLLEGVLEKREELDQRLSSFLDRPVAELSPIEHAVLCLAAYELIFDPSIPYRVAINEGVELAKLYGGTDGHKYVNGVLDKLAAEARPNEARSNAVKRVTH